MSIPVSLSELPHQVERFGSSPFLVTISADVTPHAASVEVRWQNEVLTAGCGRQTAANIRGNDRVALLWPPPTPQSHALIVDGRAEVRSRPEVGLIVLIQPSRAVLHVTSRNR